VLGKFSILLSNSIAEKLDKRSILFNQLQCWLKQVICLCVEVHKTKSKFYVHGSLHRWSISIFVQRDATKSSLFTRTILQVHSACFGCQPHSSSGIHKTVTTASGAGHNFCAGTSLQRSCTKSMTSTGGYVYSWWWVWLTPETRRVNFQNNK